MRTWARAACLFAFVSALFCLFLPPQAQASEEILSFHADIEVLPDGTLDVTETIRYAIGVGVETRGIDRDLSMNVRTASDLPARVTFTIVSVSRNGQPERYRIVRQSGLARISVGPVEGDLPAPSEQLYEIRYRTGGRVQAFDGQDVLNWSVTGEHWRIPIQAASVTVTLPQNISLGLQRAERHRPDGQATTLDMSEAAGGSLQTSTDQVLAAGESFAVTLAWQILPTVQPPQRQLPSKSRSQRPRKTQPAGLPDNWPLLFTPTLVGGLTLLAFWLAVGRDPKLGVIYPEFEPPNGIGPAEARYTLEAGYDDRCLTAAILNMAAKGALRIVERRSNSPMRYQDFRLEPLGAKGKHLTLVERAIYNAMFPTPDNLTLVSDRANGPRVDRAYVAASSWLAAEQRGKNYAWNGGYSLAGIGVGVIAAILLLPQLSGNTEGESYPLTMWSGSMILTLVIGFLGYLLFSLTESRPRSINETLSLLVFLVPVILGLYFVGSSLFEDARGGQTSGIHLAAMASGALFGVIVIFFVRIMPAPTKSGRRLLDRLEGFALYLRTAEEERSKFFDQPETTPERLEKLRPYIVALGDPGAWTMEFSGVLSSTSGQHWFGNYDDLLPYEVDQNLIDAVRTAIEHES